MMFKSFFLFLISFVFFQYNASSQNHEPVTQSVHKDTAFSQAYSVKYEINQSKNPGTSLTKVLCDRNGVVQVFSSAGILIRSGGQFLFPGELVRDMSYKPMPDKKIKAIAIYQDQFVYADDQAILSNAWAGKLYSIHTIPGAKLFCGGDDFSFLLSDGAGIQYVKDSKVLTALTPGDHVIDILFDKKRNFFWILGETSISVFDVVTKSFQKKFGSEGLTCMALTEKNELVVGTHNGYFKLNTETGKQIGSMNNRLPCADVTVIKEIGHKLWFGSVNGAFMLQPDGKFKYYSSRRWIPANNVRDICEGTNHSILILTDKGLGEIHFTPITLSEKAAYFERQVRTRHIRLGFNATTAGM